MMFKPPFLPPFLPDDIFVIEAGNQMYFTYDFLGKPTAFWVETYTLHCVYTIVKLISHLEQKEKKSRKQLIDQFYSL